MDYSAGLKSLWGILRDRFYPGISEKRYEEVWTNSFHKDIKAIKRDAALRLRLESKMDEILSNPGHYPLKKYNLKGNRAAHIGSYVILFEIIGNKVLFHRFKHHDYVYD